MNLPSLALAAALCAAPFSAAIAQDSSSPVNLWPAGKMPGTATSKPEGEAPARGDGVTRLINVSNPMLTVFKAPGSEQARPAVVICPGGGYRLLSFDKEGTEIAAWLNSIGITGVVLKYRVPANRDGAFQDIQRAVRLVRAGARELGIDPARVGVIGFSAGGHLCARLSTHFDEAAYPAVDAADQASCKPDFSLLVYPAYLADAEGNVSPEVAVSPKTPPVFIAHSEDDLAFAPGSKAFHAALEAARIPNAYCGWATGGHGYGLRCKKEAAAWPGRAQEWLAEKGVIKAAEGRK